MARKSKKEQKASDEEVISIEEEGTEESILTKAEDEEYKALKEQLLDAYAEQESLESDSNEVNSNNSEETEEPLNEEEYNKLKQQLLDEYNKQKEEPRSDLEAELEEEPRSDLEAELEEEPESDVEEEPRDNETPQTEKLNSEDNSQHKYDIDDDLEIENVDEYINETEGTQPKDLNEGQKQISPAPDIDQGLSKVAISKGSSLTIMVVFGLVLIFVAYKMLEPSPEELATINKSEVDFQKPIVKPVEDTGQTIVVPEIPKLPDVPVLSAPVPPPSPTPPPPPAIELNLPAPPPPVIPTTAANIPIGLPSNSNLPGSTNLLGPSKQDLEMEAKRKAKMNSSMIALGGGNSGPKNVNNSGESLNILRLNSDKIVATYIGDLQRIIGQGKVIDAVLESAINTDLPGSLRAVVSRDVYSEAGKNVLIQRGSRLVGTYSSVVAFGISRIQITWNRVIRPDGIDVQINSPGIDELGRTGTPGDVNNHIMRNLTTALMISMLDYSLASYLDKNSGSATGSTVTVQGGVSTTGSASTVGAVVAPTTVTSTAPTNQQDAGGDALENIQDIGKQLLAKTMAMPPTIIVNQGTPLKVYVQKDIIFPGRSANLTRVIE